MDISIREAAPADLEIICRYNAALAEESEAKSLDRGVLEAGVRAALDDPDRSRYFIAESGGQAIGQIMYTLEWSDWRNGWFWWLQSVYVAPEARGTGVFSALFGHVADRARRRDDVCGIRLYVEAENTHAQRVYSAMGLEMTSYQVMELPLKRKV